MERFQDCYYEDPFGIHPPQYNDLPLDMPICSVYSRTWDDYASISDVFSQPELPDCTPNYCSNINALFPQEVCSVDVTSSSQDYNRSTKRRRMLLFSDSDHQRSTCSVQPINATLHAVCHDNTQENMEIQASDDPSTCFWIDAPGYHAWDEEIISCNGVGEDQNCSSQLHLGMAGDALLYDHHHHQRQQEETSLIDAMDSIMTNSPSILPSAGSYMEHKAESSSIERNQSCIPRRIVEVPLIIHNSQSIQPNSPNHPSPPPPGRKERLHAADKPRHNGGRINSKLVYPFEVVKPCGVHGDATLQDINRQINYNGADAETLCWQYCYNPHEAVYYTVDPFSGFSTYSSCSSPSTTIATTSNCSYNNMVCPSESSSPSSSSSPSALLSPSSSGKSVLALTKIRTQGKGTITIRRTRG